jgi:hypothetical protein
MVVREDERSRAGWKRLRRGVLAVVVGVSSLLLLRQFWPTPAESLQRFYAYGEASDSGVAEDMLMDPLILAGEGVVPLVLEQLPKPQMPRRRYAIAFLGNGAYAQALPALRTILANEGEVDLFRGDALQAICDIDAVEGKRRAAEFAAQQDYLGSTARQIAQRGCATQRRTRAQAALGHHD